MISRVNANGLNIPSYQASAEPTNVKHEYITVPSISQVAWGAYSVFDFKEKSCLLHELILRFDVGAFAKIGGDSTVENNPRLAPAYFFFQRIELVLNNNIIDTIYPTEQFIKNQLFVSDEKRKALNFMIGDYNNVSVRSALTVSGNSYFVPLSTFFNITHMPMLYPKDDLQIRLYMEQFSNVVTTTLSSFSVPSIQCNLLAKITRLGPELNSYYLSDINKRPNHYKFHELRYSPFTVIPKSNAGTNLVLNSITGNVDWMIVVIRPTAQLTDDYAFNFSNQIKNFSLLDSTSTNITGGQAISSDQLIHIMAKNWTISSYLQDINTSVQAASKPNNFVYLYSFSSDPIDCVQTGATHNTHRFSGNEQLQINWKDDMNTGSNNATYQIDVYAYVQAVIECTATYVKKGTV